MRAALRSVLLNARKHARRSGKAVKLDPASSSRWFDGWRREVLAKVVRDDEGPPLPMPVARARTWLLKIGWRRHGLLDPAEVLG